MIVPLARRSLCYEWPRFLPAVLAIAFSALLLLVQAALVKGIFGGAALFIERSGADLWVGYPGTQSVDLGRLLPRDVDLRLRVEPGVARVEPFRWIDADWRSGSGRGAVSVYVSGIDLDDHALAFARLLDAAQRERLRWPDTVIVDRADLDKLAIAPGGFTRLNGRTVQVVDAVAGLRALGAPTVLASLDTAARLAPTQGRVSYWLVRAADGVAPADLARRLAAAGRAGGFEVWTREDFAAKSVTYWMFETGAGVGVLFLAVVVALVGATVTSQAMLAAVAGSSRQYATLIALGVAQARLRRVVLEQAAWIGVGGLLLGALFAAGALAVARARDVPAVLGPLEAVGCGVVVLAIALLSGLAAVRGLRRADPLALLR